PVQEQPLSPEIIDWQRTIAWGEGGYFGRIFLNIAGREPCGIVSKTDYDRIRNEIASRLEFLPEFWETGQGTPASMGNRVIFPDRHFKTVNGIPPDLMVYLGGLAWRSLGGIGPTDETFGNGLFTRKNDRGPDGANHDFNGIFISNIPHHQKEQESSETFCSPGDWNILGIEPFIKSYFEINSL
ncbi:hypothetical protein K8T06_16110, partial [bacterium]|nr:hypothetical protein [bacterium]